MNMNFLKSVVNDNDSFDEVDPDEGGPFMLVFFGDDGFENGAFGPFADMDAAIEAAQEAYEYANECGLKWHPTEIMPASIYYS